MTATKRALGRLCRDNYLFGETKTRNHLDCRSGIGGSLKGFTPTRSIAITVQIKSGPNKLEPFNLKVN
jgi:hypothetical protein